MDKVTKKHFLDNFL